MEEQVNLTVEQSIDINVNDDITVHIYRSPQGYVLDTYSVADGSHISTETIWEDEYKDDDESISDIVEDALTSNFYVDLYSITSIALFQLMDDLEHKLYPGISGKEVIDILKDVNPHVYDFRHLWQDKEEAAIKYSLESLPCPINTSKLSEQDIEEIFEECSKVFDSYDTLQDWSEDACQEWWAVLEKEALAHGCTYYEDED